MVTSTLTICWNQSTISPCASKETQFNYPGRRGSYVDVHFSKGVDIIHCKIWLLAMITCDTCLTNPSCFFLSLRCFFLEGTANWLKHTKTLVIGHYTHCWGWFKHLLILGDGTALDEAVHFWGFEIGYQRLVTNSEIMVLWFNKHGRLRTHPIFFSQL